MNIYQLKQQLFNNLLFGEQRRERPELLISQPLVMPNVFKTWGIDISHWNIPPVNLKRMKDEYGLSFVIIKSCDGALKSKYVDQHVETAKDAGLPFGFYNWLYRHANVNMDAQAGAWTEQAQLHKPSLGVFIDAETTRYGGVVSNPTATDLTMAHEKFAASYGRRAITYTSPAYAREFLTGFNWSKYPDLWIAHYGVASPTLPVGAAAWSYWQFTAQLDGKKLDPLGNHELDGNYWNGSKQLFDEFYGTESTGETKMQRWKILQDLNIRAGSSTAYSIIGLLKKGDIVEGVLSGWIHFSKIIRVDGTVTPFDGWCSGGSVYVELLPDTPVSAKTVTVTIEAEGYKPVTVTQDLIPL